jgi:hypothetical protein
MQLFVALPVLLTRIDIPQVVGNVVSLIASATFDVSPYTSAAV